MKTLVLTICFAASGACLAQSENWAPVGAKWWYGVEAIVPQIIEMGILEVTKDTVMAGLNCRQLQWGVGKNPTSFQYYYLHITDSVIYSVYPVNVDSNLVCKLYDLVPNNPGDTLAFNCAYSFGFSPPYLCIVDSIGTDEINGITLWKQYISEVDPPLHGRLYEGAIIERLGHERFFINTHYINASFLRCYEDSSFQYYNNSWSRPCDYTGLVGIEDAVPKGGASVSVYPNPAQDLIYVEVPFPGIWEYRLWDARGADVSFGDFTASSESINISRNLPGIYLLMVSERESGFSARLRVVKLE